MSEHIIKKKIDINAKAVSEILERLQKAYPDAGCALDYGTTFQLLVAVVLSAQTTDVSVNRVTPSLFAAFPDAEAMSRAEQPEIEQMIRSIGLYRNKASSLKRLSAALCDKYGGEVPGSFEELVKLPGVGRKTANVVLAEGFGAQKIAVDTHVFRVSNRIGLANAEDVLKTEKQLMDILPQECWTKAHHLLIFHGRRCCTARKPDCMNCPISDLCMQPVSCE